MLSSGPPATAGPEGTFVLESVPAGRYSLRAESAGLHPASINDLLFSAGALPAAAAEKRTRA